MSSRRLTAVVLATAGLLYCGGDLYRGFQHPSPDSALVASFFGLARGGAAGWAQQYVSVRPAGDTFEGGSFVAEFSQAYEICLHWHSDDELHIVYPKEASVLSSGTSDLARVQLISARWSGKLRAEDCPGRIGALGPVSQRWQ